MQKVYLLLRNNQQTGPYSFEELLALHLKPFDLVWIEGKSHGWRYPNEVEALKPYVAPAPTDEPELSSQPVEENPRHVASHAVVANSNKNIFVSMPSGNNRRSVPEKTKDPIEQKAEELRKRAQAYTPTQEPVQTNYARDLNKAEEEYTQWLYQKKTKKKTISKKTSLIVAASILIVAVGWWAGSKLFQNTAIETPAVVQEKQDKIELQISPPEEKREDNLVQEKTVPLATPVINAKKESTKTQQQEKKTLAVEKKTIITEPNTSSNETIVSPPMESNNDNIGQPEEKVVAEAPVEKKKTFKEKISDLFKNKKTEEPGPGTAGSNGERTTTRRSENKEEATITDVSDQVEIKTNKIADSWMMGVKNLKLTLVNRSNLTISSAKVEVLYYSEQDNLLEKKILSFSAVPPGKSQTVAAPDQRLADHIEHKILSANGYDNAYARQ